MQKDALTGEMFARIVGKRQRPPIDQPPSAEARKAMTQMAQYVMRAPKGIFFYRNHEEANRDRDQWLVEAMLQVDTENK